MSLSPDEQAALNVAVTQFLHHQYDSEPELYDEAIWRAARRYTLEKAASNGCGHWIDAPKPGDEAGTHHAMSKPILSLDFDGVIHSYTSGWKGARNVPDPPVDGALDFILNAMNAGWAVVIHSSRARYFGGIFAMRSWLKRHAGNAWDTMGPSLCDVRFARWKPSAMVTIDDRAVTFTGTFPDLNQLRQFQPWNKRATKSTDADVDASDADQINRGL